MTRVDDQGIPCIVQKMQIVSSNNIYATIKATLFNGAVVYPRSIGAQFLIERGFYHNSPAFDEAFSRVERDIEIDFKAGEFQCLVN